MCETKRYRRKLLKIMQTNAGNDKVTNYEKEPAQV